MCLLLGWKQLHLKELKSNSYNQIYRIKSLPNSISSIIPLCFEFWLFYFEKIYCKEVLFYQNIVGSISSSAVGYWIVVFWWKYITHSFNFRQKQIFSSSKCKALPAYPFFSILLIWNWKKHQKYWDQSHKKKHKK